MKRIIPLIKPDVEMDYSSFLEFVRISTRIVTRKNIGGLESLHFGFALEISETEHLMIIQGTRLKSIYYRAGIDDLILVVGSLAALKEAAIIFCDRDTSIELRFIFDWIILYFDSIGLTEVFKSHRRIMLPDQTFILEER